MPLDLVLFADTGNEFDYTYENVKFYKTWSEKQGIDFQIVKSKYNKDLYNYCYDKKIVPSRLTRDCTDKFKIQPMARYLRGKFDKLETFTRYIGIAFDEAYRIKDSKRKYEVNSYPLVDAEIDRQGCQTLLEDEGLPVPKKSGCWFCPFSKKQGWIDMLNDKPDLFDKAMELEQNHRHYPRPVSLLSSRPLIQIKDKIVNQTSLLDFEHTCDIAGSCFT